MEDKPKLGRPAVVAEAKKRNRAISLTDSEYDLLKAKAKQANCASVSAYVIKLAELYT